MVANRHGHQLDLTSLRNRYNSVLLKGTAAYKAQPGKNLTYVASRRFWLCACIHIGIADLVDTNSPIDCKIKLLILFATPSALAISAFQIKYRPKCGY